MWKKLPKTPSPPPFPTLLEAAYPSLLHNRNVHGLWRRTDRNASLHDHRDVHTVDEPHEEDIDHLVKVLQLQNFHSFQHDEPRHAQQRACQ